MRIPTLEQAKTHLRQIDSDLDTAIGIAISGAQAEMDGYLGGEPSATRWPAEAAVPGDVLAAALTLTAARPTTRSAAARPPTRCWQSTAPMPAFGGRDGS